MNNLKEISFKDEKDWLELRRGKIGGSSIGVIMGYSKYQTPYELWKELIGREIPKDISDKPCVIRGKTAEKPLIHIYQALNPEENVVEGNQVIYQSKENERFIANPDGFIDDDTILEIKTASIRDWTEWKDQIPMSYYCQVMWYMWIMKRPKAVLFALIEKISFDDSESQRYLKTYHINFNQEEMNLILEEVNKFVEKLEKKEWKEFSMKINI